ncbi:SymE family type I addiction module toxin [Spirosoma agri]|uniref:Type I toxin-antitoxin system SymE family toxin n=1 Tax=Spirosoma agri TaxID=1987381 RepID=A0A6M0IJC1_9BACT|nr:SymE family type I addiction module toxin [Spirosoma agri]NEU67073.1 type I toxin-antitoxin system SymE family toxin [Spirosoma agri]
MYAKSRKMGYMARKNISRQLVFMPSLNLGGQWMSKAGFVIGQTVRVTVESGKIIIEQ